MKNLILIISLIAISFACQKKSQEPTVEYQEKIVTVKGDTITIDNSTHDTTYIYVNVTPIPLNGIWYCWKMSTNGSPQLHSDWIFTFGNTTLTQNLGASGTYNYPITYYSGSVDIFFTTSATTYYVLPTNNGTEYTLTKTAGGQTQIWYLRK